jgi:apolipoprotein N-acyltransferase
MRALETGRPMVRATNTGISALIDHRGHIVEQLGLDKRGSISAALESMTGSTPFVVTGHWPVIIVMVVLLLLAMFLHKRLS